jgi:hypothetical protein
MHDLIIFESIARSNRFYVAKISPVKSKGLALKISDLKK